jgi:hypothetical protein
VYVIKAKSLPSWNCFADMVRDSPNYLWTFGRAKSRIDTELDLVPLPNDSSNTIVTRSSRTRWFDLVDTVGNDKVIPLAFGAVVGGILFGSLHCLAWNFQFPTRGEALSWKICSILTTSLPIFSILPFVTWHRLTPDWYSRMRPPLTRSKRNIKLLSGLTLLILLFAYILARLFLMVEIFRSLFYLPPEAYIDTWSKSFPHFGG